jgi:hypothetical protein
MKRGILMVMVAALGAAACTGMKLEHASVNERASHNQIYTVSAEPVIVDQGNGWVNVKVKIRSELGTDSVAFNMIIK